METLLVIFNTHFKPIALPLFLTSMRDSSSNFEKLLNVIWPKQLRSLPYAISKSEVPLRYNNGLIPGPIPGPGLAPLFRRVVEPKWRLRARAMNKS